jgi:MFS family permease
LQPSKLLFIVYNLNNFLGMYFTGFAIFGVNQIVPILEAKFKWDE